METQFSVKNPWWYVLTFVPTSDLCNHQVHKMCTGTHTGKTAHMKIRLKKGVNVYQQSVDPTNDAVLIILLFKSIFVF